MSSTGAPRPQARTSTKVEVKFIWFILYASVPNLADWIGSDRSDPAPVLIGEKLLKIVWITGQDRGTRYRECLGDDESIGRIGAAQLHVAAILALCRVTGPERERLLALCQDQHTPGWLQQHGSRLPQQLRTLIDHEDKAVAISDFQLMMVPGLLQTGDYARAVIQDPRTVPVDEIEDRVAARLARQRLFSRERPAPFTFFIHEFMLRLPVGGAAVMSDQLHHLLRMSVRPYLTLRVVPAALGAHAGIAGHFTLMEFAEFKPVAYTAL